MLYNWLAGTISDVSRVRGGIWHVGRNMKHGLLYSSNEIVLLMVVLIVLLRRIRLKVVVVDVLLLLFPSKAWS